MSSRSLQLTDSLYDYILNNSLREHPLCTALREETALQEMARMQISPEQGQLMSLLIKLIGAQKAIEVGTFTGYSALSVALALPDKGRLVACDVSETWTSIGKKYWKLAEVEHKIELRLAPAAQTLQNLLPEEGESFDFAFIDADKRNYDLYYELCLKLLRSGGLLLIDNVLWSGAVAELTIQDEDTVAIRALNSKVHQDERVEVSMLPVGDGLSLVRKK